MVNYFLINYLFDHDKSYKKYYLHNDNRKVYLLYYDEKYFIPGFG